MKKLQILAALALVLPSFAHAAGLGKLTVNSALGQPLSAQIDLVSVTRDEANSLAARLASADAYRQANLQYQQALSSVRFSVEQPAGRQPFIKVTSTRPINEPVVDLLVELAWSNGRISRAYTALIDPPGYAQQRSPTPSVETAAAPSPAPVAPTPIEPPSVSAPPPQPSSAIRVAPPRAQASKPAEYGPIKRGETLTGIASEMKPEGVTLEQMLVGLYRSNPDAFVNNMNRMKTGRILRVPAKEEIAAVAPAAARQEVRVQAADWNSYRRRLADQAVAAQEGSATSGRITARVEDKEAAPSRDVVRLSKGVGPGAPDGTGGKAEAAADRMRALEEESFARDKALAEAHERIAQLEKTIREQQRLLELKGAPLGTQQPAAKSAAEPPKAATAPVAEKPEAVATPAPAPAAAPATPPAPPAPPTADAKPKPKVVAPPPPPAGDLMDALFEEPLYLAGGGVLVLALAYLLVRRRREAAKASPAPAEPVAPTFAPAPTAVPAAAASLLVPDIEPIAAEPAAAGSTEEVDALAEAEVYIAYGRDAQAEDILKDALAKNPARQDVQLKLLEIYAARQDRAAFKEAASRLHRQTGGQGDAWTKAATMGRTLDGSDPLYAAAGAAAGMAATASAAGSELLDLELGTAGNTSAPATPAPEEPAAPAPAAAEPAIAFEPVATAAPTVEAEPAPQPESEPQPLAPDFTLEIPAAAAESTPAAQEATPAVATTDGNIIDFKLELPEMEPPPATATAAPSAQGDPGLDFKLDFGDINLNLEGEPPPAAASGERDPHWHDVQQKFDLAKAYEEMGDKEGAREVLQEVLGEGDEEQQTQAQKLLEALA